MTNAEIAEVLKELEDSEGRITPDALVEAARNRRHPLHDRFEWNDTKAAHNERISTARRIIRVVYMQVRHERVTFRVPTYVRDPSAEAGTQGYRATMRVRSEPAEAHEALTTEMARVRSILNRAKGLAIVLGLNEAVAALDAQIAAFVSELRTWRPSEDGGPEDRPSM